MLCLSKTISTSIRSRMQMNLRDEIVMQRAVVDQCDKLAVDRRRYGQLS